MAFYSYQAFSREGKRLTGLLEASSPQAVRDQLYKQGLYPVSVTLKSQQQEIGFFQRLFQSKMSLKDKIFFTKQLSVLLKSGIALADALNLMIEQSPGSLRPMITRLRDELKEGTSFAQALSLFPTSFPPLYVQLVKAGEASGQMEKVLIRLASFLEEQDEFNKAVSGAVRGPMIQLAMVFVVAGFLLTLIVPKIADVFKSMSGGKGLPMLTQIVMKISDALIHNYIIIGVSAVSIFALYQAWVHSKTGRLIMDKLKLKVPLIRYFTRSQAVVEFSQTLGLLLESGVNIAEALDIVVQIVDNQVLVTALKKARDNIIKQGKVTEYLQRTGLFSGVSIHLIGTGEQSGALDVMLIQVGNYTKDELQEYAKGMTALLNPLSMLILAVVVGTIIFAVMAPLMNLSDLMGS